jgi:digeranylgeranylglycerophospholipid reductase
MYRENANNYRSFLEYSDMETYDVAVVGAGPAGSMAARYAAKSGANTILLEEHNSIGWPVECAGLIGWRALKEAELPTDNFILRNLRGATVISPGGERIDFKAKSSKAYVVDRRLFDRALALEAIRDGAELRLGSQVRCIDRSSDNKGNLIILGDNEKIKAGVVIIAEGVRAQLARKAGLGPPKLILSGAQVELPFMVDDPEKVELHLIAGLGLFGWVIPLDAETARIGLCATRHGCEYLRIFLQKECIKRRVLASPAGLFVGGLPLGPSKRTVVDGLLAVGDVAGQVKPSSGGGIYPALICAKIAGNIAAAASKEGDWSAKRLREYDRKWRALVGRELDIGMKFNQLLTRMTNKDIDEAIQYLGKRSDLIKIILDQGDIDQPSLLMMKILPRIGFDGIKLIKLIKKALD